MHRHSDTRKIFQNLFLKKYKEPWRPNSITQESKALPTSWKGHGQRLHGGGTFYPGPLSVDEKMSWVFQGHWVTRTQRQGFGARLRMHAWESGCRTDAQRWVSEVYRAEVPDYENTSTGGWAVWGLLCGQAGKAMGEAHARLTAGKPRPAPSAWLHQDRMLRTGACRPTGLTWI